MAEHWRTIPSFPAYSVSDQGRVRRDAAGRGAVPGRILEPQTLGAYWGVTLDTHAKVYVHQLVAEAFIGPRPRGQQVNHKNGDPYDNSVSNLEYATRGENLKHAFRTGLADAVGEANGRARLSEDDVHDIRQQYADGRSQRQLARAYGVSRATIQGIVTGRNWPHVGGPVKRKRVSKYAPDRVKETVGT